KAIHTYDPQTGQAKDYLVKNGTRGTLIDIQTVVIVPPKGIEQQPIGEITQVGPQISARFTVQLDEHTHAQFTPADYGGLAHATTITPEVYNHMDHAYALTAHKGQGQTVDWLFGLASKSMDAYGLYVMLTRHREAVTLYYDPAEFENFRALQQVFARQQF